jgi:ribonuclease P protein component
MRRAGQFTTVVRYGNRARRGFLVVHYRSAPAIGAGAEAATVGLVVGKAVGGSVVRHQVSRRLRALMAARLPALPAGSGTVIRVLAGAGDRSSAELAQDLDSALQRLSVAA